MSGAARRNWRCREKGVILVGTTLDVQKRTLLCVNASLEKKATDVAVMNVKDLSAFTDYFVICSGSSDRQVRAISSAIQERMKKNGILPRGVEGEENGQWVLMDYDDLVVHIFFEPVRAFYDIEKLWSDAPRMEVGDDVVRVKALDAGM